MVRTVWLTTYLQNILKVYTNTVVDLERLFIGIGEKHSHDSNATIGDNSPRQMWKQT